MNGSRAAGREVWNTYGPTEATVVACGALLEPGEPVRIGLPLDGWDLAVVDGGGRPVPDGETGELIIGGVGLARYLDPAKDAEKYGAMPSLGWERAYRSGDRVRFDGTGLVFAGRADDQIKLGGRRIELGEIDSALLGLPGVVGAAAAIRTSRAGNQLLVGYVTVDDGFDPVAAGERLRKALPAALVPRLAPVDDLPTRTSGKIDRDALPWPLPGATAEAGGTAPDLSGTAAWVAELWLDVLGAVVSGPGDDFFDLGGGSLTAAQMVSRLRQKHPEVTVADLYENPTVGALAAMLDGMSAPKVKTDRRVRPTSSKTQIGQAVFTFPLRLISGLRWLTWVLAAGNLLATVGGLAWLPTVSWAWVVVGMLFLVFPPGRMALSALGARLLLRRIEPGDYPRGGRVHLRLWLAERLVDELGAVNLAGAALMPTYARALGAKVGDDVDLHSLPPVTGMLTLGKGCSVEPEVDLSGHWLDGDVLRVGGIKVGAGARVGTRSTLGPGAVVGKDAEVAPGSAVLGAVAKGELWAGSPAEPISPARGPWSSERPPRRRRWVAAYAAVSVVMASLPVLALLAGLAVLLPGGRRRDADSIGQAALQVLPWLPVATVGRRDHPGGVGARGAARPDLPARAQRGHDDTQTAYAATQRRRRGGRSEDHGPRRARWARPASRPRARPSRRHRGRPSPGAASASFPATGPGPRVLRVPTRAPAPTLIPPTRSTSPSSQWPLRSTSGSTEQLVPSVSMPGDRGQQVEVDVVPTWHQRPR